MWDKLKKKRGRTKAENRETEENVPTPGSSGGQDNAPRPNSLPGLETSSAGIAAPQWSGASTSQLDRKVVTQSPKSKPISGPSKGEVKPSLEQPPCVEHEVAEKPIEAGEKQRHKRRMWKRIKTAFGWRKVRRDATQKDAEANGGESTSVVQNTTTSETASTTETGKPGNNVQSGAAQPRNDTEEKSDDDDDDEEYSESLVGPAPLCKIESSSDPDDEPTYDSRTSPRDSTISFEISSESGGSTDETFLTDEHKDSREKLENQVGDQDKEGQRVRPAVLYPHGILRLIRVPELEEAEVLETVTNYDEALSVEEEDDEAKDDFDECDGDTSECNTEENQEKEEQIGKPTIYISDGEQDENIMKVDKESDGQDQGGEKQENAESDTELFLAGSQEADSSNMELQQSYNMFDDTQDGGCDMFQERLARGLSLFPDKIIGHEYDSVEISTSPNTINGSVVVEDATFDVLYERDTRDYIDNFHYSPSSTCLSYFTSKITGSVNFAKEAFLFCLGLIGSALLVISVFFCVICVEAVCAMSRKFLKWARSKLQESIIGYFMEEDEYPIQDNSLYVAEQPENTDSVDEFMVHQIQQEVENLQPKVADTESDGSDGSVFQNLRYDIKDLLRTIHQRINDPDSDHSHMYVQMLDAVVVNLKQVERKYLEKMAELDVDEQWVNEHRQQLQQVNEAWNEWRKELDEDWRNCNVDSEETACMLDM